MHVTNVLTGISPAQAPPKSGYTCVILKQLKKVEEVISKLFVSLLIGVIAGIIDVAPMIFQKLDKHACISAFVHWVVLGVIISYVQMPMSAYLKGIVVSLLAVLPVLIIVAKEDKKVIIPILIMSVILGAGVGISTEMYAT